jgi:hypothetical protein
MYEYLPDYSLKKLRDNRTDVYKLSRQLIELKVKALSKSDGQKDKDIMTLLRTFLLFSICSVAEHFLVLANASESERTRLETWELIPQMRFVCTSMLLSTDRSNYNNRTILLAGHETAAMALTWALYEISKNPNVQNRMREEIRKMESVIQARGDSEIRAIDLESMRYITAVIKVCLSLTLFFPK